jgi:hypothetical protein
VGNLGCELYSAILRTKAILVRSFRTGEKGCCGSCSLPDPIFSSHRDQIVEMAARHTIPTIYSDRSFVIARGLASNGVNLGDAYRPVAIYTAHP